MKTIANFQNIKGTCMFDEPLSKHTTFGVGGKIGFWVEPLELDDLRNILREVSVNSLSFKVIGNGSNILAGESGLPDVVIKLVNFNGISIEGTTIKAGSGVSLAKLLGASIENELSGLEFAAGIPALVGGAVKGNAGAQGKCIADVLKEITIIDASGGIQRIKREDIDFCYRRSDLSDDVIILEAEFNLSASDSNVMQNRIKNYLSRRKESIPSEPSAGCIFKNPPERSAGEIIDRLGLKGFTVGKAMVSDKHANVIVNMGGAAAKDIYFLVKHIQDEVFNQTGIRLETEIIYWGNI